ncbi:hypothetical protein SNOG_01421 [Parastagonospora nodorum SN15]|uniref:HORMA domain-containing protein n=1 Tax=Phaeosphaeria nodorum (strain SN15 / ATCC MYA-4574 / FGSC 10173) TaxID=321614 RepID=Q0V3J3_PHANO|nr:hypothetical protein SNOG_01421 [Parastagonospora nodorum SN15]EAT91070.2 hypothetical protein SNOG_01421 [Parastagonospora nodorum SN15]
MSQPKSSSKSRSSKGDSSKVHKLALKGSSKVVNEFVKAYIKKIMSQLKEWMYGGKISKLVVVITSKETGEHVERWQFDAKKTETEIQAEIQSIFRQITASVTFLPMLDGNCTFNVLVYADADSEVPLEWGDSDAKEIQNGEKVQLRSFSTSNHRVDTLVSYR